MFAKNCCKLVQIHKQERLMEGEYWYFQGKEWKVIFQMKWYLIFKVHYFLSWAAGDGTEEVSASTVGLDALNSVIVDSGMRVLYWVHWGI